MCGIAGLITNNLAGEEAQAIAARMVSQLRHRGPDGAAYYCDSNCLLVHTRLSIIDLAGGKQPIHNEDKTVWVVFNGEIFNYIELRERLEFCGHNFYTHSDTEVIVHLYEEYGNEFVQYLNGQFAICLWDSQRKQALLVRDRVGIAPLYYCFAEGKLWFASEIKALLAGQLRKPTANSAALDQMLHFWAPVSPAALFREFEEVSPGQMVIFQEQHIEKRTYWDFQFPAREDYEHIAEGEAAANIRDLLIDSTRIRLRADVPVGAYLSGGLDSSILTSLIHHFSDSQLRTFSLTFDDSDLNEESYQRQLVDHLSTIHSSVHCRKADVADRFERSIWHTEAPIIRTAPIPMGLLSSHVRENNIKVVLTGEGADEIFGGYDIFKEAKLRNFWSVNPDSNWRHLLIKRLYPYLKLPSGNAAGFLTNFFGGRVEDFEYPLSSHHTRIDITEKIKLFFKSEYWEDQNPDARSTLIQNLPKEFGSWSYFAKAQYLEIKTLMSGYLLSSQGDRMLMMNSVEGRFPFLDHRLIEYVNKLHPKLKMKAFNEKYILKQATKEYLPRGILERYKQPYRAPMVSSFYGEKEYQFVNDLLDPLVVDKYGYFDSKKTELLKKKIRAGRSISYRDNMAFIFILSTQSWHNQFIELFQTNFPKSVDVQIDVVN